MCGSSVAVHPHLHMNHISSISMDLVGTIGRSPNSQAMQGGPKLYGFLIADYLASVRSSSTFTVLSDGDGLGRVCVAIQFHLAS